MMNKNYTVKNNVNITIFTPEQTDWLLNLTYKEPHFISSSDKQNLEYSFVYSCDFFSTFKTSNNLFWGSKNDHTKIFLHENIN